MRKVILVTVFTALLLGGCSSNVANEQPPEDSSSFTATSSSTVESTDESTISEVDASKLSYFYPDKKDITKLDDLHISVHSKLGNDNYKEVDIRSSGFVAGTDVFIYVDGQISNIDSDLSTGLRTATPIVGDDMKEGLHSLELVQYVDNDDENGEVLLYARSTYTIDAE
jgi:uncharacterized protein YceK